MLGGGQELEREMRSVRDSAGRTKDPSLGVSCMDNLPEITAFNKYSETFL